MSDQRMGEFLEVAEEVAEIFASQEYEDEMGVEYMLIFPEVDVDLAKAFVRRFRAIQKGMNDRQTVTVEGEDDGLDERCDG